MHNRVIGLVIPRETHLFSPWAYNYYFTEILRGTIAAASLFGWNMMIHYRSMEEERGNAAIEEKGLDGLVFLAPSSRKSGLMQIKRATLPVMVINERYKGIGYVDTDNKKGASKAVEYFISMGHRKIAIITGDMETSNGHDRFEGFKAALEHNSLKWDEALTGYGNFTEDSGYREMKELLKSEEFTALFCANDLMAIGAIRAVREEEKSVPGDISIIGFDDLIISEYLNPPLTSVRQPLFHLGKEAVITLISIIRGEKESCQEIEIDTRLIKRESVGKLKT